MIEVNTLESPTEEKSFDEESILTVSAHEREHSRLDFLDGKFILIKQSQTEVLKKIYDAPRYQGYLKLVRKLEKQFEREGA